jgi:hypothetical protein
MAEYVETDRDRWAELEAQACIRTAEAFEQNGRFWKDKPLHSTSAEMIMRCAIKAETWREIAARLRQPAAIGREMAARDYQ